MGALLSRVIMRSNDIEDPVAPKHTSRYVHFIENEPPKTLPVEAPPSSPLLCVMDEHILTTPPLLPSAPLDVNGPAVTISLSSSPIDEAMFVLPSTPTKRTPGISHNRPIADIRADRQRHEGKFERLTASSP